MKTVGDEIDEAGVTTGAHTLIEAGQAPTSKGEQREGVASNGVSPLTRAIETMGPAARIPLHTRVHVGGRRKGRRGRRGWNYTSGTHALIEAGQAFTRQGERRERNEMWTQNGGSEARDRHFVEEPQYGGLLPSIFDFFF